MVDPSDPQHWAVSTDQQGTFVSTNGGGSWRPRDTTQGARLAWPAKDALYSLDRTGKVRVSRDGGRSWEDRGDAGGLPSEFSADEGHALRGGHRRQDPRLPRRREVVEHRGYCSLTRTDSITTGASGASVFGSVMIAPSLATTSLPPVTWPSSA